VQWGMLGIGFLTAMLSGIVAIRFLFFMINRTGFLPFAVYRIILGGVLLYLAFSHALGA
jgi:undecaprenyl-diphosphatase